MPGLEGKVARLEGRLAALRTARSPEAAWAALFLVGGTSAQVGRACWPCRGALEDQLLAYGSEARRMAELGAAWPVAPIYQRPVQHFAELLACPPGTQPPHHLVTPVETVYYGAGGWRKDYGHDPGGPAAGYDAYFRTWLYVELLRFISPDPTAAELRRRLHDPGFRPAPLAFPSTTRLETWPVGLLAVLALGFQSQEWWTFLANTGRPPPPSFFDLPEEEPGTSGEGGQT